MGQTHGEITQNLAERRCRQVARRDDSRVARRLYRKPLVDGVYRLAAGALLDDVFHDLQAIGVMGWREEAHGAASHRQRVPFVQYVLRDSLKTLCGMERINALPSLLCSDEALMPLVGCNAPQGREGICRRGATTRQGARLPGPLGPATLANTSVKWHVPDLEAVCKGAIGALAQAGVFDKQVTGIADGTDVETPAHETGCGQGTRTGHSDETRGRRHESEGPVYGWHVCLRIDAATKMPLAVTGGQMQEHEARWTRALGTQARLHLQGDARRPQVVFDQGFWDGTTRWWLDQHGITCVGPAQTNLAVTAEARAQAAADEGRTLGRRVHTGRPGPGNTARTERLETEVVGLTGLPTEDQEGTPAQGRQPHRRAFQSNPSNAVGVRKWRGKDDGPAGTTVFLTNAAVATPVQPFDDDAERSLIEHCCLTEATPQWERSHPPHKSDRAARVPVPCTRLLFALATAYRRPCEREATGGEPVGWQRWRRQLREQTRDTGIVCAQGDSGLFPLAEYSRLVGVQLTDVPPEVGSRPQVLAKSRLPARD